MTSRQKASLPNKHHSMSLQIFRRLTDLATMQSDMIEEITLTVLLQLSWQHALDDCFPAAFCHRAPSALCDTAALACCS